jgi:hypothetical protein
MTHPIAWFGVERPTDSGTTFIRPAPEPTGAWLCEWCSGLNDFDHPRRPVMCPRRANTTTRGEIHARHQAAVRRARRDTRTEVAA